MTVSLLSTMHAKVLKNKGSITYPNGEAFRGIDLNTAGSRLHGMRHRMKNAAWATVWPPSAQRSTWLVFNLCTRQLRQSFTNHHLLLLQPKQESVDGQLPGPVTASFRVSVRVQFCRNGVKRRHD